MQYALVCWSLYLILILMRAFEKKELPLMCLIYLSLSVWLGIEIYKNLIF